MTSRNKNKKEEFIKLLQNKNIIWDELIMGVNPGTRYVINDIKPSNMFIKQAVSFNVVRDLGIDNIICNENIHNINIIKKFKGGSLSNTYLLEINNKLIVRKHIFKNAKTYEHYLRLKRQCDDLKRFYYYNNLICPKILNEQDSNTDYYYDMEYMENYEQLNLFDTEIQKDVIYKLLNNMNNNIYCYKKYLDDIESNNVMDFYFKEKIYSKFDLFEKKSELFNVLINNENVKINNNSYYGLKNIFKKIDKLYKPTFICPIHGDLNFENILYNKNNDSYKIIDMEGSMYVDSPMFDLGKLFQTVISKYEVWSNIQNIITNKSINNIECNDSFFKYDEQNISYILDIFKNILNINDLNYIKKAGIYYMANYFLRMVPFLNLISEEHGLFGIIMSIVWLNNIL